MKKKKNKFVKTWIFFSFLAIFLFYVVFSLIISALDTSEWIVPQSVIESSESAYFINRLIDEDVTSAVSQYLSGSHYSIIDLGQSYNVGQIKLAIRRYDSSPLDIENIYVSDDLNNFGESLGSLSKPDQTNPSLWDVNNPLNTPQEICLL